MIRNIAMSVILVLIVIVMCMSCAAPTSTETTSASTTPTTTTPATSSSPETTSTSPTTTATATSPETTTDTPITSVAEGNPFIWRISSENTHIYLMGSIHLAEADLYPLADVIENAFGEADILVVEVNINNIDETRSLELLLEYGTYPAGEGLKDNLSEGLYERLEEQLAEWGIPLSLLDSYRPWFIANLIEVTSLQAVGYSAEYGIDLYFLEAALMKNMEIVELETEEFQIGLLADVPDDVMIKSIEQYLDEPITAQDIEELFEIWETGDVSAMEEYIFEGLVDDPSMRPYYESLFIDRNYNMQEKIEEFLEDNSVYFIVVGAGHLVGEEGLLNLLEQAGYDVEQLEY